MVKYQTLSLKEVVKCRFFFFFPLRLFWLAAAGDMVLENSSGNSSPAAPRWLYYAHIKQVQGNLWNSSYSTPDPPWELRLQKLILTFPPWFPYSDKHEPERVWVTGTRDRKCTQGLSTLGTASWNQNHWCPVSWGEPGRYGVAVGKQPKAAIWPLKHWRKLLLGNEGVQAQWPDWRASLGGLT